jgi:hypothetical protein
LLYRGSENQFSAAAFHTKCGNVKDTFTLIKTEFGNIIAGFTPYSWHSVSDYQYVNNPEGGTFLLLLFSPNNKSKREKMVPTDTSQLIHNNSSYGPTFGGGYDINISDQCNINNSSYANFPHSYNTADKRYTKGQDSYR